MAISEASK